VALPESTLVADRPLVDFLLVTADLRITFVAAGLHFLADDEKPDGKGKLLLLLLLFCRQYEWVISTYIY
jgi:hypothetical protein